MLQAPNDEVGDEEMERMVNTSVVSLEDDEERSKPKTGGLFQMYNPNPAGSRGQGLAAIFH